jgi:myotubularin-related protein 6/7/8
MDKIKVTKVFDPSLILSIILIHPLQVNDVQVIRRGVPSTGTLHLTSHHLIFSHTASPQQSQLNVSSQIIAKSKPKEIWVTYPIISYCTFRPSSPTSGLASSIRLRCRDFTFLTFHFSDNHAARDVFESIKELTCKLGRIEKLYAFSYRPQQPEKEVDYWKFYNAKQEWKRQGISEKEADKGWRISTINLDYKVILESISSLDSN